MLGNIDNNKKKKTTVVYHPESLYYEDAVFGGFQTAERVFKSVFAQKQQRRDQLRHNIYLAYVKFCNLVTPKPNSTKFQGDRSQFFRISAYIDVDHFWYADDVINKQYIDLFLLI